MICHCGCKQLIIKKPWHKIKPRLFIKGHHMRLLKHKRRLGEASRKRQKGSTRSKKVKQKISKTMIKKGINVGKLNPSYGTVGYFAGKKRPDMAGPNHPLFGKKRPDTSLLMQRANNPGWKGGIRPLRLLIRHSSKNKNWVKRVFTRDNFTCQDCGQRGGQLDAHHKKSFSKILQEFLKKYSQFSPIKDKETLFKLALKYIPFWRTSNGQTLCRDCHKLTINFGNKSKVSRS